MIDHNQRPFLTANQPARPQDRRGLSYVRLGRVFLYHIGHQHPIDFGVAVSALVEPLMRSAVRCISVAARSPGGASAGRALPCCRRPFKGPLPAVFSTVIPFFASSSGVNAVCGSFEPRSSIPLLTLNKSTTSAAFSVFHSEMPSTSVGRPPAFLSRTHHSTRS